MPQLGVWWGAPVVRQPVRQRTSPFLQKKCRGNCAAHLKLQTDVWLRRVQRVLGAVIKIALGILHWSAFPVAMY